MKRIFTLLFCGLLIACMAFAGYNDGKISITHLGYKPVRVEIDGKNYGSHDRLITIRDLSPGYHIVRVYYDNDDRDNHSYGKDDSYYRRNREMVYYGKIKIRPNYHVDIVINRFGKTFVDERAMDTRYDKDYDNDNWYYRDNRGGWYDDDRYSRRNDDRRNDDRRTDDRWDDRRDDRRDDSRDDRNDRGEDHRPMQDQAFAALMESMKKESFESTRLALAKQSVERNYFLTLQVKQLVQLFSFETNRLEMAKFMYRLTLDRENYFQLYDVFSFSSSKEELANYMRSVK